MILGGRTYVEIPGEKTHELPPLLLRSKPQPTPLDQVVDLASNIVEDEDLIASPTGDLERRKMDLAFNLIEHYFGLITDWQWGDSILEWIRQCEEAFGSRVELRNLLYPDVWPHAGRSSFVKLLEDKHVETEGVKIENAVGIRLTFRQPPPISCFSNQFLFYLNSPVANSAYQSWATLTPGPVASLPPERFRFQVHTKR